LTGLDGEACAWVHIQTPEYLGVHEVGRREAPAVHHNVRKGTQVVRALVNDLHFEAWNLVAGPCAILMSVAWQLWIAPNLLPAFPYNLGAGVVTELM